MAKVIKINHIALVSQEVSEALDFWQDKLGLDVDHIEEVPSQHAKVAFLQVGESAIEIVEPTSDLSGVARYLQKRGPGIHHICLEVDDIDGLLAKLKEKGVQLIDEKANVLAGRKMAFIHPKSSNGVLVELCEVIK